MQRHWKNAFVKSTAAMMVCGSFLLPFAARAATISGFSDTLTRHQASVASDHTILFVTPSGVDSSTDTITVDFDSAVSPTFTMGAVSFDDIDLAVDTTGDTTDCSGPFTDKTLAATPAAGVWGAAISSNVLTLSPPTDAAVGEIPAGDCLQIEIGTNSGGTDQITNPTSAVTLGLNVGGSFGDTGTTYVAFNDADQVTVSATVASTGGGGGGPEPPPGPPIIENIQVISITETNATVTWITNVGSDSTVEYGTTISYGSSEFVAGSVFAHNVPLSGLAPGTEYHFRVKSLGAGGETTSGDNTFTTLDNTPPVISNVNAINVTASTVTITWDTNEDATSRVDYDILEPYAFFEESLALTNSHQIELTGLSSNTIYRYRVTSEDASGNSSQSFEFTFETGDDVPPVLSNILATDITADSATITWATDELADSKVVYGTTVAYGSEVIEASLVANHSVPLSLLASGTEYHFAVVSADALSNTATSTDQTFTTLADTTPPANVSGLTATAGDQLVDLEWVNPGDADYAGTLIVRKTGSSPTNETDGTTIYDGTDTTFSDTGLTNGTTYFYGAFTYDASGNFSSGALADATPFDLVPPGPATSFTAVPSDSEIQLTWINPLDSDFASVQIQVSTTSFPTTISEGTTTFAGTGTNFLDTGLTNDTTYFYTIFAYDTSGNISTGTQATATPFVAGPICGNTICEVGENSTSCAIDCPVIDVCGDDVCGTSEDSVTCAIDCPAPPVCGDFVCEAGENSTTCVIDCPVTPTVVCGDGVCEGSEDSNNCVVDCPAPPTSICGNDICEAGENSTNCAQDCPLVPVAPVIEQIDLADVMLRVRNRTIVLQADSNGAFHVLPSRTLTVTLVGQGITETIKDVFLRFNEDEYIMQIEAGSAPGEIVLIKEKGIWEMFTDLFRVFPALAQSTNPNYEADVALPDKAATILSTITVNYANGTSATRDITLIIDDYGVTVTKVDEAEEVVPQAEILLQNEVGGDWFTWNATPHFQTNPTSSNAQGEYGFMVPIDTYRIIATKEGYRKITTEPITNTNVINKKLTFIKIPKKVTEVIIPGAPLTENILNVTRSISEQSTYFTSIVQQEIIEDPRVEEATTNLIVPTAAIVTTAVVVTSVQAVSFLSYLYFLITQPLLLIARRKRKEYGTIFNSLSKLPIDLAIVRLFRKDGRLVRTLVTDKQGRYAFLADPGDYRMEASKPKFIFPSVFMKGMKEGVKYLDLYHGEVINVSESGAIITANIPMDPEESVKTGRRLIIERILRKIQDLAGIFSVFITGIAYLLYRFPYLLVIFLIQLALYFIFRRISRPKRSKNWGIVYDEDNQKPIPYAVARIVETEYNKVLESQVTDSKGRYNFLVGNNKYFVSIEKPGYETAKTGHIDLTKVKEGEAVVAEDVALKKTSGEKLKQAAQEGMSDEEKKAYDARAVEAAKPKPQPKLPTATTGPIEAHKKVGTDDSDENEMKRMYMEKMAEKQKAETSESKEGDSTQE